MRFKQLINSDVLGILTKEQKIKFFLILTLMVVFAIVEAFTYSIIVPYLNIVLDPKQIFGVSELKPFIEYFNISESIYLVIFISIIFGIAYTIKTILHIVTQYYISKFPYDIARANMQQLYTHYFHLDYNEFIKKIKRKCSKY